MKTAVEFLIEKWHKFNEWQEGHYKVEKFTKKDFLKSIEQAKQMEKEQIIDAHYQGYRNEIGTTEVSEQYYNETYGGHGSPDTFPNTQNK